MVNTSELYTQYITDTSDQHARLEFADIGLPTIFNKEYGSSSHRATPDTVDSRDN